MFRKMSFWVAAAACLTVFGAVGLTSSVATPTASAAEISAPAAKNYSVTNSTTQTTTGSITTTSVTSTRVAKVLALVNAQRKARGIPALKLHTCLTTKVAQPWAKHLAATKTFTHRNLSTIWSLCSGMGALAENIGKGYTTPEAVVKGWMNSAGHKANILNRTYTKLGVGVAAESSGTLIWVTNFAS